VKIRNLLLVLAALCTAAIPAFAQSTEPAADAPAAAAFARLPWEYGPFFQGGMGIGDRDSYKFTAAGFRVGKVITDQHLGSIFRGQFELAGEIMPYWQAFTPPPHLQQGTYVDPVTGLTFTYSALTGGGTFTGVSLTPVILRWDFKPHGRFAPWFQGAGGLIYTTHKFTPDVLVKHGTPGGTSVWNFSPQGGIGFHYFIRPGRAITFAANGVHISSASLGDHNPGVNASVSFQIGYTFFK
jgi:hypothetical protein